MPERLASCGGPARDFSRIEELWARFAPLTPYGKDAKEARTVLADRSALERLYDLTDEAARELRELPQPTIDRITYHLKRLPRIPFSGPDGGEDPGAEAATLELIEIFQVKKFLANYRAVLSLCSPRSRELFGLGFGSGPLAALLEQGGSDPETFYVADSYHPSLAPLRARIAETDEALARARAAAKARARSADGLDFSVRDFLVLPHDQASALLERGGCPEPPGPKYAVEAYDGRSCVVRLQDEPETLLLAERRDELAARERDLESEALAAISRAIGEEAARLLGYAAAVRDYDLARARAVLASELGCSRPVLSSPSLSVEGGRFVPLEEDCARMGMAYAPLTLRLEEPAAVLFGSNMGGKTVALQSLAFFQIAAQSGLYVPAIRFETRAYPAIRYVGEVRRPGGAREAREGLSGFGFEIRAFVEAWEAARSGGAFLVFDEFARTTSSAEAEAILSAAIATLSAAPGTRSLFSTHFRGVERLPGARYLRMRGLDREAAARAMLSGGETAERIRGINRLMRYEIVEADEEVEGSDAIAIAALLGLDEGIASEAAALYAARGPGGPTRGKDR